MQHFQTDFSTAGSQHKARHQDALGFYTYSFWQLGQTTSQQIFNSSHNLHAANFACLGPVLLTFLSDTCQDADPCQGGESPLCCLWRCTALQGLQWGPVGPCSWLWIFRKLLKVRQAAARTQSLRSPIFWWPIALNSVGVSSGCSMHLNNHLVGYPQVRHPQTREHISYLALPCLSFSTCQMGIIINASYLKNWAGSKCSGHMQQCKTDFVTLAVGFTSPHSPIDISTADATTGLGKVLLNAWAFKF